MIVKRLWVRILLVVSWVTEKKFIFRFGKSEVCRSITILLYMHILSILSKLKFDLMTYNTIVICLPNSDADACVICRPNFSISRHSLYCVVWKQKIIFEQYGKTRLSARISLYWILVSQNLWKNQGKPKLSLKGVFDWPTLVKKLSISMSENTKRQEHPDRSLSLNTRGPK